MALSTVNTRIDYITRTPPPRPPASAEIEAIRKVFGTGKNAAYFGDKALTGTRSRAGVQEDLFAFDDNNRFSICESAHITSFYPVFADMPIVRKRIDNARWHGDVEFLRLRRHQPTLVSADGCVILSASEYFRLPSRPGLSGHHVLPRTVCAAWMSGNKRADERESMATMQI